MSAEPGVSVARDRAYYEERRQARLRAARRRRLLVVGVITVALLGALGVGVGFAGSSDRIAAGVRIGGLDVSGMNEREAIQALVARATGLRSEPVLFVHGERRFSVIPAEERAEADWATAVREALEQSEGFFVTRGFERLSLRFGGVDVAPPLADRAVAERLVARFASELDEPAREAALLLEGIAPAVSEGSDGVVLDRVAALGIVSSGLAGFERGTPIVLPVQVTEQEVTAADLAEAADQVERALAGPVELVHQRRRFVLEPRELAALLRLPSGGETAVAIGGKAADDYFAGLAAKLDRKPRSAEFTVGGDGLPRVVSAKVGRKLDARASMQALFDAVVSAETPDRTVRLAVATAEPELTTEDAKARGITGVVASYTTIYGGDPNRLTNVALVAELIDDTMIPPGATFSFNDTTGERNAEKGFQEAPVIINGELKNALGGGVCQVSTTLFNAAFEAGLSIEQRTNHALYISHYPTGRDATVNYPDIDLVFTNDTEHWLWLRTFVGSSELTVNLYGTPTDRRIELVEESPLEVTGQPKIKRIRDKTLEIGTRIVEEPGSPARSVAVRRVVYAPDGSVMYDTLWWSYYQSEPRVVRIGTKPKPQPVEEPAPPVEEEPGAGAGAGDPEPVGAGAR
jgi:vancomycin resistance protein YoaR